MQPAGDSLKRLPFSGTNRKSTGSLQTSRRRHRSLEYQFASGVIQARRRGPERTGASTPLLAATPAPAYLLPVDKGARLSALAHTTAYLIPRWRQVRDDGASPTADKLLQVNPATRASRGLGHFAARKDASSRLTAKRAGRTVLGGRQPRDLQRHRRAMAA